MAVGRVVIQWALIEQQLDRWAIFVFHHCGGDTICNDLPRSLKAKITFLRKSFNNLAALQPAKDEAKLLLTRISSISQKRHEFAHGAITNLTPHFYEFTTIKYSNRHYQVIRKKFSARIFPALASSLLDLWKDTQALSKKMENTISLPKRWP